MDRPVPEGWVEASLEELGADLRQGFAAGRHNRDGRGLLHLRPMNVSPLGDVDLDDARHVEKPPQEVRLCAGDIVFNNTNSLRWVGKTALWDGEPVGFSNHMTRIRVPPALDAGFLAQQLHLLCLRGYFRAHARQHVNQASIALAFLRHSVPLRIPPVDSQRETLKRLNDLERHRRRAMSAIVAAAEGEARIRTALVDQAFRDVAPWQTLSAVIEGSIHYGIVQPGDEVTDGVPVVRSGDLHGSEGPRLDELKRVAPEIERKNVKTRLSGGEILLSVRGTVGPVAVAPADLAGANVTRGIAVIRPGQDILAQYLALYLSSASGQAWLRAKVRGVAQQSISLGDLAEMPVPTPARSVQHDTVEAVEAQLGHLQRAAEEIEAARARAQAAHRELLEQAFAGKLARLDAGQEVETAAALIARARSEAEAQRVSSSAPSRRPRRKRAVTPVDPIDDSHALLEALDGPLSPADLLDRSSLPNDDVDRFYRALAAAVDEGHIAESRPSTLAVVLTKTRS